MGDFARSFWDRLPRWLRPPRTGEPDRDRRRWLVWASLLTLALGLGAYLAATAVTTPALLVRPAPWLLLGASLTGLALGRAGHEGFGAWLFPSSLLAAGLYTVTLGGPATSTTLVFSVPLMVIAASLLLGARPAILFGVAGGLLGALHFYGASQGWFPEEGPTRNAVTHGVAFTVTLALITLYSTAAARGAQLSLASAQRRRVELDGAQQDLAARAERGEALAALGRDVAEGLDAPALRQRAVEAAASLLDVEGVSWVERGEGDASWHVLARVGEAPSHEPLLEDCARDPSLTARACSVSAGGRRHLAAMVSSERRHVALIARLRDAEAPAPADGQLLESLVHLVATAVRHRDATVALTARQRELAQMVDRSPDAILTVNWAGKVTMANPAASAFFGREHEQLLGHSLEELGLVTESPADDPDEHQEPVDAALRAVRVQLPGGGERVGEVNLRAIDDAQGGPSLQLVVRDITARREAQRERRELGAKLAASQRMEALGKLAGGVAHDFNNLLTILMNLRELLTSEPLTDSAQELVDDMGDLADRAAALTRQLLTFARKQPGRPQDIDVAEAVRGLEPLLSRLVGDAIELTVDAPGEASSRVDPSQLEQVVMNLVVNARDAMPSGGELAVRIHEDEGHVRLSVRDSGVGMDAVTAGRIFEPFFTTKGRDQGTGLGLSTVHGIVTRAGGDIAVESAPGRGTTFVITLPRVASPSLAESGPRVRRPREESGTRQRPVGVLLVDDEPLVRRSFSRGLRKAGLRVVERGCAEEALEALREDPSLGLMLVDVNLPDRDGPSLVAAARRERPEIAVVYTSGHGPETLREMGIHEGRDYFVAKPFAPDEMVETVRAAMRGGPITPLRRARRASGHR